MNDKVILKAEDLDGFLTKEDNDVLKEMQACYQDILFANGNSDQVIDGYKLIGEKMKDVIANEERIHVYPFSASYSEQSEASRLIQKLRVSSTEHDEFVYYIQRAYEMLFKYAFFDSKVDKKAYRVAKTPVDFPMQNYCAHKLPDIDSKIHDCVMCVMLRGALLPSMIVSKELQEFSSDDFVTPFALFKISRDDTKSEADMQYLLDLNKSFFNKEQLDGKTLVFADPMNATGGSIVTIVNYLRDLGIKPKKIIFLNVISALKGALRVVRALDNIEVYTMWMDPSLNEKAYIMPGLGDAGDRLNGKDIEGIPRNIIQLIGYYGINIINLYRSQIREIEKSVLPD